MSPAEAAALVPGLRPDGVLGATYCPDDGYFDRPQVVVEAFAAAARARGARFELGSDVLELHRDGDGWQLRTSTGTTAADHVVVAAAAGTAKLLAPLGFDLPVTAEARHLFFGEALPGRQLDPLVVAIDRGIAVKQLADGRLLASDLRAVGDPVAGRPRWEARLREQLATVFPGLDLTRPTMVTGVYDMTPDAQPVVDELADGLWVAAGFSGHGFMIAPSTGALIAGALAGDADPEWRSAVGWERFASLERTLESQVI